MVEHQNGQAHSEGSGSDSKPTTKPSNTEDPLTDSANGLSQPTTYSSINQRPEDSAKTGHKNPRKWWQFGKTRKEVFTVDEGKVTIEMETSKPPQRKRLIYGLTDTPPLYFLLFFALQQAFLAISTPLGTAVVVAEAVCAQQEDSLKVEILSSTMLMMGLSTFCMTTLGSRLPIFQGPAATYIIPLIAMSNLPEFHCPETFRVLSADNSSYEVMALLDNDTVVPNYDIAISRINAYAGSLIAAGAIHFAVGITGISGLLGRVIGPMTIVPTVALFGIFIHPVVVSFAETYWPVAIITCATCIILSLYLEKKKTPIPMYSKEKGWHIFWYPIHQIFALLIGIVLGWMFSFVFTEAGVLSNDPDNVEFNARTDARSSVLKDTPWFLFPYPSQFGTISFSVGAFVTFLISALLSIIDSIADYNATAKASYAAPPPPYAINRGIAVEGLMTMLSGSLGCGHATVSYGENIGAISMSKVASRSVFQGVGLFYILLAIVGKLGAVFITMPYSVIGGSQIVTFGLLLGVVVSYLQFIDLNSTRNLSIIGMSILLGLSIPFWMNKNSDKIDTGNYEVDNILRILLSNPSFVGAFLACFLDNTIPGTDQERGITPVSKQDKEEEEKTELSDFAAQKEDKQDKYFDDGVEVYRLPFLPDGFRKSRIARLVPIFDVDDA